MGRSETFDPYRSPKGDLLGTLITVLGEDAAFKLIEAYGGTRVYLPQQAVNDCKIAADHRLANVVGAKGVQALAELFTGMVISVPVARKWRVRVYRDRGFTEPKIARMVGCSEDTVWRLLRDMGMSGLVPPKVLA